MKVANLN